MSRRPIYLGKNSCYAVKKKRYCPERGGPGVDTKEEVNCIISKIIHELRTGKTFNHDCKVIRMTKTLAKRRLAFLARLACTQGSVSLCRYAKAKVREVLKKLDSIKKKVTRRKKKKKRRKRRGRK